MELKKRKTDSCDDYGWTDYMSLQFTQNVSLAQKVRKRGNRYDLLIYTALYMKFKLLSKK